jgi:hypothetical protein
MLGKRHDNFLRDIRKYIDNLGDTAPKYFIPNSSTDGGGRARVGYSITEAGCRLIAGRIIGLQGDDFRAKIDSLFTEAPEPVETAKADLTVEEVANKLGCSERNVYRMIQSGKLPALQKEVYIPTTKTFVTEIALENYIKAKGVA